MDEKRPTALRHQVILAERERLSIDGVLNVKVSMTAKFHLRPI